MSTGFRADAQAAGSAQLSHHPASPAAGGPVMPGVPDAASLESLGEYYKSAFLDVHALRFKETAALTRLLEEQRIKHDQLLEEQRIALSGDVSEWKQKAVTRFRKLQAAKAEASKADSRIAELQSERAVLESRVGALEEARSSDRAQLEKMRSSYSWRLTRPLRQLHGVYRRLSSR